MNIDLHQNTYSIMVLCIYIFSSYLTRRLCKLLFFCTSELHIKKKMLFLSVSKEKRIIFIDLSFFTNIENVLFIIKLHTRYHTNILYKGYNSIRNIMLLFIFIYLFLLEWKKPFSSVLYI